VLRYRQKYRQFEPFVVSETALDDSVSSGHERTLTDIGSEEVLDREPVALQAYLAKLVVGPSFAHVIAVGYEQPVGHLSLRT
jgi:hypothetical protein